LLLPLLMPGLLRLEPQPVVQLLLLLLESLPETRRAITGSPGCPLLSLTAAALGKCWTVRGIIKLMVVVAGSMGQSKRAAATGGAGQGGTVGRRWRVRRLHMAWE